MSPTRDRAGRNPTDASQADEGDAGAAKPADKPKPADMSKPADKGRRSKSRSLLMKGAVALAATLAALGLGEVFVRVAGLAPELRPIVLNDVSSPYQVSKNPILGYEHKVSYRNDHPDHVVSFTSTNAHGQRDVERTLEKPPGVRRIILLGDSVVESLEVDNLDDMMNRQLEMLYGDGKTEVLNFGVNGYCTLSEVELLKTKGLKFDPDLVVLVFVENDYHNFNDAAGGTVAGLQSLPNADYLDARSPVIGFFVKHSQLFRLAYLALPKTGPGLPDPFAKNRQSLGDNNVVVGLRRLRKLADEHKFDVVIAVWPTFEDDEIVNVDPLADSGGDLLIERLGKANGIPVVQLSRYFQEQWKTLGVDSTPLDYYTIGDGMHVNETGSHAAAEVLKQALDDLERQHAFEPQDRSDAALDAEAAALAHQMGADVPEYNFVTAVTALALTELDAGRHDQAMRYCRIALRMDPDDMIAHAVLARCYFEAGDLEQAEYHLKKAKAGSKPAPS